MLRQILLLFFVYSTHGLYAETDPPKKTVCLNMIVKNEKDVITRCLESCLPMIDYWVIVDTGSTDGTQKIIKDYMREKAVPGKLHERPWKNFEHNRNEALSLARGCSDYVLFIDADEYFVYDKDFTLPNLDKDSYYITMVYGGTVYEKTHFIRNHPDWKWVGVLHEYISNPNAKSSGIIRGVTNTYTQDGARSKDQEKYVKDAQVLEKALLEEPDNPRYVFYLAQSYRDAKNNVKSIENYEKRVFMGGWREEVFYSLLQIAILQERLGKPHEFLVDCYKRAFDYWPTRLEPLYHIARLCRIKQDYQAGYEIAKLAHRAPEARGLLFFEQWIVDYGLLLEQSICAYWIGDYEESKRLSLEILNKENIPDHIVDCVKRNLAYAELKIVEIFIEEGKNTLSVLNQ